jgi:hypothetical protein
VIVAMLRTAPPRRRSKSTAHIGTTTGDHPPRARLSGAPRKPHTRAFAGAIGEAYGRFIELPVPIVLAALWLFGAILLAGLVLGLVSLAAMALA